jgi:glycosyltransferase involved in cell wall biosynthesis
MVNSEWPLVSCIMLAGRTPLPEVHAAIQCFRQQTYPYKELVIVNNARSQFQASELVIDAERGVFIADTPTHYSAGMARNHGIAAANGQIIAQFDPDFWHAPNRIEAQVATVAESQAHIAVLASCLSFSSLSGAARPFTNAAKAIMASMVFIRPKKLDYPDDDKHEEHALFQRLTKAGMRGIAMDSAESAALMCKLYFGGDRVPENVGLSSSHFRTVQKLIQERSKFLFA